MNHSHQDLTMWAPKEELDRTSASSISKHKIRFQVVSLSSGFRQSDINLKKNPYN